VVALAAPDGRVRRALARLLLGDEDGPGTGVSLLPRVADPVLARLPDGLVHRLRTGRGLSEPEPALEEGARALAWPQGLARLEAARGRLARLRGSMAPGAGPGEEALLARIRELEGSPAELGALERELRTLRGDDVEVAGDLEQATMEWLRERQDAETQLQTYRDRARELRARLQGLERAGAEADCPTCGRPLGEHLGAVREALEEEWDGVVQDGSWWRRRREQLEPKPDRLQDLERRALRVHAATEELGERVELTRSRVRELEDLRSRLAALVPEESGVGRAAWEAADRALAHASRELRARARARILDRGSGFLTRITAGRVLGMSWAEPGHLVLEGQDAPLHPPSEEDAAAALVAVRLASLELAWEVSGAGGGAAFVLGEVFDRMDEAARVRAVDLLRERRAAGLSQVVVVTRGDVVDLFPEGFDAVVELRGDGSGVVRLPAGVGMLRTGAAASSARRPVSRPAPAAPPPPP
jgi:hypothetical protein